MSHNFKQFYGSEWQKHDLPLLKLNIVLADLNVVAVAFCLHIQDNTKTSFTGRVAPALTGIELAPEMASLSPSNTLLQVSQDNDLINVELEISTPSWHTESPQG